MIFLTVGTTKFPYIRLLELIDEVMDGLDTKEKLIAQVGPNHHQFTYQSTETFKELRFDKLINFVTRARVVIIHGGLGSVLLAIQHCKNKPLMVPRSKVFGEHVDDHQIFLAWFLKKKGSVEAVFPEDNLKAKMSDYIIFPKKIVSKLDLRARGRLVKSLKSYTESIKMDQVC